MIIASSLIGLAIILFLAKSKIPNSDLERLANITSIVMFIFGVISLILPLSALNEFELLKKLPTASPNYPTKDTLLFTKTIPLSYTSTCEFKELVADFDKDEILSIDYEFTNNFFSRPVPSHVSFIVNGADFSDGFKVDEILSYSIAYKIKEAGEYRLGFIWHGAYSTEVTITLPRKNWQIVVSDCSKK